MDACPPHIDNDIVTGRDEVKNWASSLKALSGIAGKTKFFQFIRFGSNDELMSETMEIWKRLLQRIRS
jgi:hypothetical protein